MMLLLLQVLMSNISDYKQKPHNVSVACLCCVVVVTDSQPSQLRPQWKQLPYLLMVIMEFRVKKLPIWQVT